MTPPSHNDVMEEICRHPKSQCLISCMPALELFFQDGRYVSLVVKLRHPPLKVGSAPEHP